MGAYSSEVVSGSPSRLGPQNSRSRTYNEYNTTTYCSPPPKRSQCQPYVSKDGTFNEKAFDARSIPGDESSRPCNINRKKFARDISDPSSSISYSKNYAVYSTNDPNVFDLDIPVTFYIGKLSGNKALRYKEFEERAKKCVNNNPVSLNDGTRKINLRLIPRSSEKKSFIDDLNKSPVAKSVWGVSLSDTNEHPDSKNYGFDIPCTAIVHEMLHITGLHDEYHNTGKYTPNQSIYEKNTGGTFDSALFEQGLLDQPKFDCRKSGSYLKNNIMGDDRPFDLKTYRLGYTICYPKNVNSSPIKVSTGTSNVSVDTFVEKRSCNDSDTLGPDGTAGSQTDIEWVNGYQKKLDKEKGIKRPFYIAYYKRENYPLPPSLSEGQVSSVLFPNCLGKKEVKLYGAIAKNVKRDKHLPTGRRTGCRK